MGVRPQVVVIGAGFGGLAVARGLAKQPVDVTLIDRHNFTTFQPLLYQVATAGLNPADVAHPVRGLFHRQENLRFRQGEVDGVDWEARRLHLAGQRDVPFDQLVIAVGAVVTWFGVPGAAAWALPLYTLDDAVRLRNHILGRFEAADADPSLIDDGALTFVVVGGGPTGVETAGALAELVAVVFRRDYPQLDVGRARVVLVEARDALLAPFKPGSQRHAEETLRARQVEVRLDDTVAEVTEHSVRFTGRGAQGHGADGAASSDPSRRPAGEDGPDPSAVPDDEVVPAQTVVWAAGVTAHPLAGKLELETTRGGRIVVDGDLAVPDHPGVWVVGDVGAIPGKDGAPLPQLAPVAMQSGAHVAKQIGRQLDGKPLRPFRFHDKGTMATIGRRAAVAELPGGLRLRGTLAWIAWLFLHLLYLAGIRNRASVLLNWAWSYVTWDRAARLILGAQPRRPAVDADRPASALPPAASAGDGSSPCRARLWRTDSG
jgi:NADH dehydrogenase